MRAQNLCFSHRPSETSRSRQAKKKICREAKCKSWVISRGWQSGAECCFQALDSAATTAYKNGNGASDKLSAPKPD